MNFWLRTIAAIAVLAVFILGLSLISRAPTLNPKAPGPEIPPLIRSGAGEPDVAAEAALIKRLRGGEALFERESSRKLPIASLTKLMTALILAETAGPLEEIEFSEGAKKIGEPDDKRSAAPPGERLKAEDVLKMLLISSDNDASYAAAEYAAMARRPELGRTLFQDRMTTFVEMMNERAAELGLAGTNFANPAGRDDPNNFSTAGDLARLAEFINQNHPELWAVSRIQETFVFGRESRRYGLVNTNPLLQEFPAIYGSKTGFDDEAKGALLIIYQLSRQEPIAIVLLRSRDRFADGRAAIQWLETSFVLE